MRKKQEDKQLYLEERKTYIELLLNSYNTLDKHMFLLASGAILLSITFLEKITGNSILSYQYILLTSWVLLIIGLISVLLSFFFSGKACHRSIEILDNNYIGEKENGKNIWSNITGFFNLLSIFSIIAGIICLATFSFKSIISSEVIMNDKIKEGLTPPAISQSNRQDGIKPPKPSKNETNKKNSGK